MGINYIPRQLRDGERAISEATLLAEASLVVVLAEPGAGKTDLLTNIARQLGVEPYIANVFRHQSEITPAASLVIDALDEVARIDQTAIDNIIVKARETQAKTIVFACRSSEWDEARTQFVRDCFASEPTLVWLQPLDEAEQQILFTEHVPGEDFFAFRGEVERFELLPLLGNPQFLILFADAFVQSGRRFTTKSKIFVDAIERLTSERSTSPKHRGRPPTDAIVAVAQDVFAKLLLSGATGVSLSEGTDIDFPYLPAISAVDGPLLNYALDTRLFKPSAIPAKNEPIHRIIAEYCAGKYLARRIDDPSDRFSLRRCLALVAPNGVVRDELRGLLGWMAAVGSAQIQEACIQIDPYAVLANGDPSQLTATTKHLLLKKLRELTEIDPYFRRSDAWRRFSVAGFFDSTMVPALKDLLVTTDIGSHLHDLVLELLQSAKIIAELVPELRSLVIDSDIGLYSRMRAQRLLLELPGHDQRSDFVLLVEKHDEGSQRIAIEAAVELGFDAVGKDNVLRLLRQIAETLNSSSKHRNRQVPELVFRVEELTQIFDPSSTAWLLDELSSDLACCCGASRRYRCDCLIGVSKVIGILLDRYFECSEGPYEPSRVWGWTKHLMFQNNESANRGISVKKLQEFDRLRQCIHETAFSEGDDINVIRNIQEKFRYGHAGLYFKRIDRQAILIHAFETRNVLLWEAFCYWHNSEAKEPDELRALMRGQARQDPRFLRVWSKIEQLCKAYRERDHNRWGRSYAKRRRRDREAKERDRTFFRENRREIEAGRHWPALRIIADYYLIEPDKLDEILEDRCSAGTALQNCFTFLESHIPTLPALAEGKSQVVTRVLHAACLAVFRATGRVDQIDVKVLRAVKTDVDNYRGVGDRERKSFETAIDRCIFADPTDIEIYAREFIEPQMSLAGEAHTDVGWLCHKDAFKALQKSLALEWLINFPEMPISARNTLFDVCAQHADRAQLNRLIEERCTPFLQPDLELSNQLSEACEFWFLRAFFFLDSPPKEVWHALKTNSKTIFHLERVASWIHRNEQIGWPDLSAEKVYSILDAYVDVWPKVDLPSTFGTGDPPGEIAYRFLTDIVHLIGRDTPNSSLLVLERLLSDERFSDFHRNARSMKAAAYRKRALQDSKTPRPKEVANLLDRNSVATVEDLRALLIEEIGELERWLRGAETNPLEMFYPNGERLDEPTSRNRIVDLLQTRMSALNLSVEIERHMSNANRCDITASAMIDGRRKLLVIEVKGQWHPELFSAASAQLHDRYGIHPDAAHQGIYLVLWFGGGDKIGGRKNPSITTATQLRQAIIDELPKPLRGAIDVCVLDLS